MCLRKMAFSGELSISVHPCCLKEIRTPLELGLHVKSASECEHCLSTICVIG